MPRSPADAILSRLAILLLSAVVAAFPAGFAPAAVLNLKDAPFAAAGDGTTDDRPALARAFAAARPGDTVLIPPGSYRMVLTKAALAVPAGVTLWGRSGQAKLALSSDGGTGDYRAFLRTGSDVTLEGLTFERDGDFPAVLLPVFGDATNVTVRDCRIVGNAARFPDRYCHAIQLGVGTLVTLVLDGVEIEDCTYGLFQANDAKGTVEGVTVDRSRFERNAASDLEFNSPRGAMRNVFVRDCIFRDNRCKSAGAGFAVGFANVASGCVQNCRIENYSSEALHVEDRSADIQLAGNTIGGGSMGQPNGVIMVLSDSRRVTIDHNIIDARPNTNAPHLILVTAGGKQFANPSEVTVADNVLVNGAATKTWYLQPGSGPAPSGNLVWPAAPPAP